MPAVLRNWKEYIFAFILTLNDLQLLIFIAGESYVSGNIFYLHALDANSKIHNLLLCSHNYKHDKLFDKKKGVMPFNLKSSLTWHLI